MTATRPAPTCFPLDPDRRRLLLRSGATLMAGLAGLPSAQALEAPKGQVILTVRGLIEHTNAGRSAQLDLAMLEALPQRTFSTMTPWDAAPLLFQGPLMRDLLTLVGARGTQLRATALNDYRISIPVEDAQQFDLVVAHRMNGQRIPVRSKGPLFVVYPFDSDERLRNIRYYERSIWQLKDLDVLA